VRRELILDPHPRFVQIRESRRAPRVDTAKQSLQEPHARFVLVIVGQPHQHRNEETLVEDQVALGVIAACGDLHRL
jgi:hypothetical protein